MDVIPYWWRITSLGRDDNIVLFKNAGWHSSDLVIKQHLKPSTVTKQVVCWCVDCKENQCSTATLFKLCWYVKQSYNVAHHWLITLIREILPRLLSGSVSFSGKQCCMWQSLNLWTSCSRSSLRHTSNSILPARKPIWQQICWQCIPDELVGYTTKRLLPERICWAGDVFSASRWLIKQHVLYHWVKRIRFIPLKSSRPICLTTFILKTVERVIHDDITTNILTCNRLYQCQPFTGQGGQLELPFISWQM